MTAPDDLPGELRQQTQTLAGAQLAEAAGSTLNEAGARALANGFLSALVHDVAVVHGMLAHLGVELPAEAGHGAIFDDGRGVQLGFALPGDGRVSMTHLNLPGVPDYTERITVYATDRIVELTFPSPYLRHLPTRLTLRRPGEQSCAGNLRLSRELRGSLPRGTARLPRAPPPVRALWRRRSEQARRDVELLTSAFRKAVA